VKRIAVVEDNADNRLLVGAILDGQYDLVEYVNGREAVEALRTEPADLVLLDISLPEMDGTEVLRRLRAVPALAKLPVVALTAHAMRGDRERYLELGFDEYVTKPILDEQILLDTIARLLART
jgi:CheY-like chemotaxis protein